MIVGWKLYYGDGAVISSQEKSWEESPSENVQLLIVFHDRTYKIWHDDHEDEENYRDMYFGYDYFWQYGNGQVEQVPEGEKIKLGQELPPNEWTHLYNRALRDTKWQPT